MNDTITALESRTVWASIFGFAAMLATVLHHGDLSSYLSNSATLDQWMAVVGGVAFLGTGLFRILATKQIASPSSGAKLNNFGFLGAMLLVVLLGGGLSGCGGLKTLEAGANFTITQNELDATRTSYDAAFLTPAAHYRQLGFCAPNTPATLAKPCADPAVVAKLRAADKAVAADFTTVQNMINAGQNSGLQAAYNTLLNQIATAEALTSALSAN